MATKPLAQLSPAYRQRLERYWAKHPETRGNRSAARGHSKTPERPERAIKDRTRYQQYLENRGTIERQIIARKERLWGDDHKYKSINAQEIVTGKIPPVGKRVSISTLRKAMKMSDEQWRETARTVGREFALRNYENYEWAFLFYH